MFFRSGEKKVPYLPLFAAKEALFGENGRWVFILKKSLLSYQRKPASVLKEGTASFLEGRHHPTRGKLHPW